MNRLSKLERLLQDTFDEGIYVVNEALPAKIKGLYYAAEDVAPLIALNKGCLSAYEETCVLAEELGHYYTSAGDLLSEQTDRTIVNKQEHKAQRWAANKLIPLDRLIQAYEAGIRSAADLADYLEVTPEFLHEAIEHMKKIHGLMTVADRKYIIYFEPFGIFEQID